MPRRQSVEHVQNRFLRQPEQFRTRFGFQRNRNPRSQSVRTIDLLGGLTCYRERRVLARLYLKFKLVAADNAAGGVDENRFKPILANTRKADTQRPALGDVFGSAPGIRMRDDELQRTAGADRSR